MTPVGVGGIWPFSKILIHFNKCVSKLIVPIKQTREKSSCVLLLCLTSTSTNLAKTNLRLI